MMAVETQIEIVIEVANNARGNGYGHPENIDEEIDFVLHHAAKGDKQKVFDHASWGW